MPPLRTPDAFLLPPDYAAPHGHPTRPHKIGLAINAALGSTAWLAPDLHTGRTFARADPAATRMFPTGHERQGEDRYDWFLGQRSPDDGTWTALAPVEGHPGEEVYPWIGFLKPGAEAQPGPESPEVQASLSERIAAYQASLAAEANRAP